MTVLAKGARETNLVKSVQLLLCRWDLQV